MKKIECLLVGGARPDFVKLAALTLALDFYHEDFSYKLVHTGQHSQPFMSKIFFDEGNASSCDRCQRH